MKEETQINKASDKKSKKIKKRGVLPKQTL